MRVLHRSAITINYKKPFIEWSNKLFPYLPMEENVCGETKTYLIDNLHDNAAEEIKKHFKIIFETELEGICINENEWPKKLSLKLFNEWFSYEISDWVMDLSKKSIYFHKNFLSICFVDYGLIPLISSVFQLNQVFVLLLIRIQNRL